MKKVIYTANIGDYDSYKELPQELSENWEGYYFTDNKEVSVAGWNMVYVDVLKDMPEVATARNIKILAHKHLPDADYTIWVDGTRKILKPLDEFLDFFIQKDKKNSGWYAQIHTKRNCLYQEMRAPRVKRKTASSSIKKMKRYYEKKKFPPNIGLPETPVIIRKNTEKTQKVNEMWWDLMFRFRAYRDQIILPYVLWKCKVEPVWIDKQEQTRFVKKSKGHVKK